MKSISILLCTCTVAAMIACTNKKPASNVSETPSNLPAQESEKATDPFAKDVDQFGYIVPDLEVAMKDWLGHGVGPWFLLGPAMLQDNEYLGKPSRPRAIIALTQVGGVQLELIQPLDKEASAYRDWLAAGKSGLEHCGFKVQEQAYQTSITQAMSTGARVQEKAESLGNPFIYMFMATPIRSPMERVQLGNVSPAKAEAIRNSVANGCEIGELIPVSHMVADMFEKVRDGSANWDGKTDPVRHVLNPVEEAGFSTAQLALRINRWYKEKAVNPNKQSK